MGSPAPEDPPVGEKPDVWALFQHYDKLYFQGALADAPFVLNWDSPRMKNITSGFGSCLFGKTGKSITLYKQILQHRPSADLKNALLHLMIHAIVFVKHGMTCLSFHGPVFRSWMDAINACSVEDHLRPKGGYCITTTHDFSQEKHCSIQGNVWKCELCAGTLLRATKLGPPSDSCCIENVRQPATCGNKLCHWHNHKIDCGGKYVVPTRKGQKMVPKGELGLLSETSEMSKSQGGVQESDSDAGGKIRSQVGSTNARSPGSSSSKKASRSSMPEEDYQAEIVLHQGNLREKLFASEKNELFSMVSCNNAKSPGSCSSEKTEEDFQKAIVLSSASPPSKLKWKQASVASLYSFMGRSKANVLDKVSSSKKAHRQRAHDEETRKPIAAAPQSILKQQQDKTNSSAKAGKQQQDKTNSSAKAGKQQQDKTNPSAKAGKQQQQGVPKDARTPFLLQPVVVSQGKQKQSNPAAPPKRPRTGRKTDPSPPRKKKYACISVWAGIYESDRSSGSDEPLVNKRTERRKREREAVIKAQQAAAEEEISSRRMDIVIPPAGLAIPRAYGDPSIPASGGVDIAAAPPADLQLMAMVQPQPPAATHQVFQPHSADPPAATHQVFQPHSADPPASLIPVSSPDVIDISDDD
ncbi:unnamed protein product [Alopecurus aequalis]